MYSQFVGLRIYRNRTCVTKLMSLLDLSSLCSVLRCAHERSNPRLDVPVLWPGLLWTQDPEVPVVEEVLDHHPDGKTFPHCVAE